MTNLLNVLPVASLRELNLTSSFGHKADQAAVQILENFLEKVCILVAVSVVDIDDGVIVFSALVGRSVGWSAGWLADWLVGWFIRHISHHVMYAIIN